jgi:hypothetical protein
MAAVYTSSNCGTQPQAVGFISSSLTGDLELTEPFRSEEAAVGFPDERHDRAP